MRPHYTFKTKPLGKQLEAIEDHWHEPVHAFLCRVGTGKSKMTLDHAGMQYMAGMIGALIILAPNGVHEQWVQEAIPTHLSDQVPYVAGTYSSTMGIRAHRKLVNDMTTGDDMCLRILSITHEGVQTKRGKQIVFDVLRRYRCMVVVDESHRVSNIRSVGFRAVKAVVRCAATRRIATGTLIRQNPYAAFGQFDLMGEGLLGSSSFTAFKADYTQMLPKNHPLVKKIADDFRIKTGKVIVPQIPERDENEQPIYCNLTQLRERLAPWSTFMSLADVNGAEPIVLQSTRYVHLTAEQQRLYYELVRYGVAEAPNGQLTAENTLALATRLSQVVGGFSPSDDNPAAAPVGDVNPKLEELFILLDELGPDEKVIIWCKFRAELNAVTVGLQRRYGGHCAVLYSGGMSSAERTLTKQHFVTDKRCRYFVGQPKAAGTGLDKLQSVCSYMIFYSNDYSYIEREQAIGRAARTGGSLTVNVTDIMAQGTVDQDIVRCMQNAEDVHEAVLRRGITRKWV